MAMAASIRMMTTTASSSMRVKPPSSVLRSSSIRHENQQNTFLPFFLHASVTAGLRTLHVLIRRYAQGPLARWNQNLVSDGPSPTPRRARHLRGEYRLHAL